MRCPGAERSAQAAKPPTTIRMSESSDYASRFRPLERPTEGPGAKLHALRTARDLCALQAARGANVTVTAYTDYELGRTTAWSTRSGFPITSQSAERVAKFFGVTVEDIWGQPPVVEGRMPYAQSETGAARLIRERTSRSLTQAEAAARIGICQVTLTRLEGLTLRCFKKSGKLTKTALLVAKFYKCDPAWLFGDVFVHVRIRPQHDEVEVSEDFFGLEDSPEEVLARKQLCALAMSGLSDRQQSIMESRAEGETLGTIGERWGLTRERVRQIEAAALVKMRAALEAA